VNSDPGKGKYSRCRVDTVGASGWRFQNAAGTGLWERHERLSCGRGCSGEFGDSLIAAELPVSWWPTGRPGHQAALTNCFGLTAVKGVYLKRSKGNCATNDSVARLGGGRVEKANLAAWGKSEL
jgi:hypothetical protein